MARSFACGLWIGAVAAQDGAAPDADGAFLIEAEDFNFLGAWTKEPSPQASNGFYLKCVDGGQPAIAAIRLPAAGTYQVWTRTRCYVERQPEHRRYQLLIDGVPLAKESGCVSHDGWLWENVGSQALTAGEHALALDDTGKFYGRCDAVYLTTSAADSPEGADLKALASRHLAVSPVEMSGQGGFASPRRADPARPAAAAATLDNGLAQVVFALGKDRDDKPVVTRQASLRVDGQWVRLPLRDEETLFLLASPGSGIHRKFFPQWEKPVGRPVKIAGKEYDVVDVGNPFLAGNAWVLTPDAVRQADPQTAEVVYEDAAGHKATTRWTLADGASALAVTATFTAPEAGEYSVGFKAFQPWQPKEVDFDLLPPLYHYQRLPAAPSMVTSSMTPQPLALVQARVPDFPKPVSLAVAADPARFPFDWPTPGNARYGFSLLNEAGAVQPTVFVPVLGQADSKLGAGETKTVSWNLLMQAGPWTDALAAASDRIFRVTDYRRSDGTSLTEAAFNILDLLKDDKACAWDARLKGFWQIESPETVSQAAPLALVSAALLTRDEDFYRRRALPTIEFVLSRAKPHFAAGLPKLGGAITPAALQLAQTYLPPAALQLTVPSLFYGTSYWQGLDALLGGKNAWVRDLAFQDGKVRTASTYSSVPAWSDLLAAYRLDPTPDRLQEARQACDAWMKKEVYGKKTNDMGMMQFANVSYYPYWWDLLDLYEATREKAYLEAARYCALLTISQTSAFPMPPAGDFPANSNAAFADPFKMWWRNDAPYRLGWPPTPQTLPERKAPAWILSRVGLSLEQPVTYFNTGDESGLRNILLSAWTANLLRLYGYTGEPIFQTYARNGIVGRFASYPGYYLHNYTDLLRDPKYPCQGPDVTDIYFHHIAAHLAMVVDYLVTEAAQRSQGKIAFPWAKQQGYVWLSNRVYGDLPGTVYGQEGMSLWLDRAAAKVGSDQLDYLTARGPESWAIVLMNESDEPVTAPLSIDVERTGILADKGYSVVADGKASSVAGPFPGTVTVSPKGIAVLTFPARKTQPAFSLAAPVLDTKPVRQELGGDWGTLHAFRIRSPFGKDSLYVVLTGHPAAGKAELELDGDAGGPRAVDAFPYELTVYPWPQDKEMVFRLKLTDAAGKQTVSDPIRLAGTSAP